MQIKIQQTHHTIADFDGIFKSLTDSLNNKEDGLFLYPEMFLTGYPLQDLCLQRSFITCYLDFLNKINDFSLKMDSSKNEKRLFLLGGLDYTFDEAGLPLTITNMVYSLKPGHKLEAIYTKKLLPNYDIYDEEKYFTPGTQTTVVDFCHKKIGIMICEDMWPSTHHPINPLADMTNHCKENEIQLDLVVNLSASPWHIGKDKNRIERANVISKQLGCPFAYINRVGGEDEILFDGRSFLINNGELVHEMQIFKEDSVSLELPISTTRLQEVDPNADLENTWESLFGPSISYPKSGLPILSPLDSNHYENLLKGLIFGVQEYSKKSGLHNFDVALSGGLDSALVLTIVKLALVEGQDVQAIYMPSQYSRSISYDLSLELCEKQDINFFTQPIKFIHSTIRQSYNETFKEELDGLGDENIQSRIRGGLLYARSNCRNSMVLNTSNKSELAVGYSTLYGDSVGALSVLGDLYKSEVFELCRYINSKYGEIIPVGIIDRPPSAELREDQEDCQSLPPYERLDPILEGFLSYRLGPKDLIKLGFLEEEVMKAYKLYTYSEFKRKQFAPIIKVKAKSFGFGYRVPICKKMSY